MRLRSPIIAAIAFFAGVASYAVFDIARSRLETDTARHWKVVEEYRAFVLDAANVHSIPGTGFRGIPLPPDPTPSLAALVNSGELEHVDLVLPAVPNSRAANHHWMKWAQDNPDILYATGNSEYAAFKPSGTAPLHLDLWFRRSATAAVQQLIHDLEKLPAEGNQTQEAVMEGGNR